MSPDQLDDERPATRRLGHLCAPLRVLCTSNKRPSPAIRHTLSPALDLAGEQSPRDDDDGSIPDRERTLRFADIVEQGCRQKIRVIIPRISQAT